MLKRRAKTEDEKSMHSLDTTKEVYQILVQSPISNETSLSSSINSSNTKTSGSTNSNTSSDDSLI